MTPALDRLCYRREYLGQTRQRNGFRCWSIGRLSDFRTYKNDCTRYTGYVSPAEILKYPSSKLRRYAEPFDTDQAVDEPIDPRRDRWRQRTVYCIADTQPNHAVQQHHSEEQSLIGPDPSLELSGGAQLVLCIPISDSYQTWNWRCSDFNICYRNDTMMFSAMPDSRLLQRAMHRRLTIKSNHKELSAKSVEYPQRSYSEQQFN